VVRERTEGGLVLQNGAEERTVLTISYKKNRSFSMPILD